MPPVRAEIFSLYHPPGGYQTHAVEIAEILYPDAGAAVGGVDKLPVAHIDAHMGDSGSHAEENQVPRLPFALVNVLYGLVHLCRACRNLHAERLLCHVGHESAAVKS